MNISTIALTGVSVFLLAAASANSAFAASATLNFGFASGAVAPPTTPPAPPPPPAPVTVSNSTTMATTPVLTTIQQTTDLNPLNHDSSGNSRTSAKSKASGSSTFTGRMMTGIDSYFSDSTMVYSIPFSYALTPDFYLTSILPIMSRNENGVKNTGIGDFVLSAKYRWGEEEKVELQGLLTTKFATGDENKGLGTGTYDISLTGRAIKRLGDYRFTAMGGFNQPLNDATYNSHKITYGTQLTFMGGAETNLFLPNLWFGLRGQGISNYFTVVDGKRLNNSLQTFDLVPEVKFFTGYDTAINFAVIAPVYTHYMMPDTKKREVVFNLGIFKAF